MIKSNQITIVGAGPAGLSAAITSLNQGSHVIIHERSSNVGHRFHGDFQGLENWTTERNVLDELSSLGINLDFDAIPFSEVVCFDPEGHEYLCQSTDPFFYLVRRGCVTGSLDMSLKRQVLDDGVEINFNSTCQKLPEGGIVAQGPHRADVIAVGYVFETKMADGAFVVLSDKLAPQGYAYLLIHKGWGTLASCMFNDFHNERLYLDRSVNFFKEKTGLSMINEHRFGGSGNFSIPLSARKDRILHTGESAGFQDAFAGFGLRYAILSGHFAAKSILENDFEKYDQLWKKQFLGLMRSSIVNRYMYAMLGNFGYKRFIKRLVNSNDARRWIWKRYNYEFWKRFIYPFAQNAYNQRLKGLCVDANCHCTWCRCQHET